VSITIVLIGAGSTVFTPGLMSDVARSKILSGATLRLVDVDPQAVELMVALGRRLAERSGSDMRVEGTLDRREALRGADFVTTTIAVGGAASWGLDLSIPDSFGIRQTVGDTAGPGGFLRALRHIPELVAIAADIADVAPRAWMVNYSNPLTANVRAVTGQTPIRAIGLCHGTMHTAATMAAALGVPANQIRASFAGVNHLCWLTDLRADGIDLYPRWRELVLANQVREDAPSSRVEGPHQAVSRDLMQVFDLYPAPGDRHVCEFFPWYLGGATMGGDLPWGLQGGLDRTWEYIRGKSELWHQLQAQAYHDAPVDVLLDRGAEAERLVAVMEGLVTGREHVELAVNVPNRGSIVDLPPEAVVEVPAVIGMAGIRPLAMGRLPHAVRAVLEARVNQQEMVVKAALSCRREDALAALVADPLVPDTTTARAILAAGLRAHASDLPAAWHPNGIDGQEPTTAEGSGEA
jgi:alpha-galactosidase